MNNSDSTSVEPAGYCPYCSGLGSYIFHTGLCPQVTAREFHPDGRLKRIEFAPPRIAGLHHGKIKMAPDFDELVDSTKWAREVVIEESTLLGPGRYTIVLGELFKVIDDALPDLAPLPEDAGKSCP